MGFLRSHAPIAMIMGAQDVVSKACAKDVFSMHNTQVPKWQPSSIPEARIK